MTDVSPVDFGSEEMQTIHAVISPKQDGQRQSQIIVIKEKPPIL